MANKNELLAVGYEPTRGMRPWYWYATVFCGVLACVAVFFDLRIAQASNLDQSPGDVRRILKLSEFFAHGFCIAVVGAAIWMLAPRLRRFIPRVVTCAILPGMTVHLIKLFVTRDRPAVFYPDYPATIGETWQGVASFTAINSEYISQSFPSAHAATVVGLAMGLGWILPRGRVLFFTLAVLASFQRVAFGAHWCSDVFAGAAFGLMMGGALTQNWLAGYFFGLWESRFAPTLPQVLSLEQASLEAEATKAA